MKACRVILIAATTIPICVNAAALNLSNNVHYSVNEELLSNQNINTTPIEVDVNGSGYMPLTSQPEVDAFGLYKIKLNDGDVFSIRTQAADGNWYHTKNINYNSSQFKSISIEGERLPLGVYANGREVARFYNAGDWVAAAVTCDYKTSIKKFSCNVKEGPNGVNGFIGEYSKARIDMPPKKMTATGYFRNDKVIGSAVATFELNRELFSSLDILWRDGITGAPIGFANFGYDGFINMNGAGSFVSGKCPKNTEHMFNYCMVGDVLTLNDHAFIYNGKLFIRTAESNSCPVNTFDDGVYGDGRHCYYNNIDLSVYGEQSPSPFIDNIEQSGNKLYLKPFN
ncbi:hypothetical protein JD508_20135 [Aeromonas jandaei]|uniref:hypothetical protein n=1 Tax=Aeromonas jandaei TaxID=650 RepID=UPI00191E477E|nr:hypothetical protein [Aeromonas jandaei]MBL0612525.1 hypothetical protein [Aeromonas jandaei]